MVIKNSRVEKEQKIHNPSVDMIVPLVSRVLNQEVDPHSGFELSTSGSRSVERPSLALGRSLHLRLVDMCRAVPHLTEKSFGVIIGRSQPSP